ncbi:TlyA family RNA methyltransferase [Mycoplasma procyoni]|uniref:TlyA family RNA methyltransferase n=1 Tax=Mycoplasma procyoni TaxID=568784 RepID=UPI00197C34E3|nr:TlyA family RNA methyltransferase [Mycoplasma procyoni]MBN3534684.1 TlyA family RNA methyltransferase [Mycoplasma procyoni]
MKRKLLDIVLEMNIEHAENIIRMGQVLVNGQVNNLPHSKVLQTDKIEIKQKKQKEWVSRGAYKLLKAIEVFNLDFKDKVVLDIGSSTGGFSQVALEYGAKQVFAIDVGTNQLDYNLRINPKIVSKEKYNLKNIKYEDFLVKMDVVVCDVSFISLKEVFKVLGSVVDQNTQIMLLIKPQFEASSKYVETGGFVQLKYHDFLINRVKEYANEYNFEMIDYQESPIQGNKSKNVEYISLYKYRS